MSAEYEGCQNCVRLIDNSAKGYDDIVSAPYVTESGDLYCIPCGQAQDRADRAEEERESFGDVDPYGDLEYQDRDASIPKAGRDL